MKLMVLLLTYFASSLYESPQFRASAKHFSRTDGGSQPTKTATAPKYQSDGKQWKTLTSFPLPVT